MLVMLDVGLAKFDAMLTWNKSGFWIFFAFPLATYKCGTCPVIAEWQIAFNWFNESLSYFLLSLPLPFRFELLTLFSFSYFILC